MLARCPLPAVADVLPSRFRVWPVGPISHPRDSHAADSALCRCNSAARADFSSVQRAELVFVQGLMAAFRIPEAAAFSAGHRTSRVSQRRVGVFVCRFRAHSQWLSAPWLRSVLGEIIVIYLFSFLRAGFGGDRVVHIRSFRRQSAHAVSPSFPFSVVVLSYQSISPNKSVETNGECALRSTVFQLFICHFYLPVPVPIHIATHHALNHN